MENRELISWSNKENFVEFFFIFLDIKFLSFEIFLEFLGIF